ncbi:hypothetical protein ACH9L7_02730 [Haloferax sp. S1W]|uniref:hypothetical protein n=1 Tax=Haloferax sp. S1W TaxID=3377110 RepID=UPI0037C789E4
MYSDPLGPGLGLEYGVRHRRATLVPTVFYERPRRSDLPVASTYHSLLFTEFGGGWSDTSAGQDGILPTVEFNS